MTVPTDERVVKEGFMVKRAQGKNKVLAKFHINFKQRWFVLTDHTLFYFTNQQKTEMKGKVPIAEMQTIERVDQSKFNRDFMMALNYGGSGVEVTTLYMQTVSNNELNDWIATLTNGMSQRGPVRATRHRAMPQPGDDSGHSMGGRALPAVPNTLSAELDPRRHNILSAQLSTNSHNSLENPDHFVANVLHTFKARMAEELTVNEGEVVTVTEAEDADWWKARSSDGREGYVPANYLAPQNALETEPYFHGIMSRGEADSLLRAQGINGSFLLRESSNEPGQLSLSMKCDTIIRHYRINHTPTGALFIAERATFQSVPELILHYQRNRDGLPVRLMYPIQNQSFSLKTLGHDTWEIQRSELTFEKEIGSGQFGAVHRGMWRGSTPVAIKVVKEDCVSYDEFLSEANVMKKMQHSNLVKLLAVVTADEPICIVTELMTNGNLLEYLRGRQGHNKVSFDVMVYMAIQINNAMEYLEVENFIHRDLAARNVLVGNDNVVKVADFGLSRLVENGYYTANEKSKFAVKWTAPEVVTMAKFSVKSDVWSFGIVLFEIFSNGRTPYEGMGNKEVFDRVQHGYRLEQPVYASDEVYALMVDCWLDDPNRRPTFKEIQPRLHF